MDGINDPFIVQQSLKAALQLGRFQGQGSVSFLTRDRAAVSLRRLFGPRNREHFHPLVRRLSNHLYGVKGDEALLQKLAELKDDPEIINFIYSPITPQSAEEIEFDRLLKAEREEIPDEKFDELVPKPPENEVVEGVESQDATGSFGDSEIRQAEDRGWPASTKLQRGEAEQTKYSQSSVKSSSETDAKAKATDSHDRTRFPSRGSLTINRPGAPSNLPPTIGTGSVSLGSLDIPRSAPPTQTGSVGLSSPNTGGNLSFPTDALNRGTETVSQSNVVQGGLSQAQIFGRKALTNWIPNAIGTFIPIFKPSEGGGDSGEPPWGSPTTTAGYAGDLPKNGQVYTEEVSDAYYYEEQIEPPRQEKKGLPPYLLMLLPVVGFFGIFLFMDLSKSSALLPPYEIPGRPTSPVGDASTNVPGLVISKNGPARVNNNEDISYTINLTYSGSAEVEVVDQIPANTQFVSATGNFSKDPVSATDSEVKTITWLLKDNQSDGAGKYTFSLVLHPTKEDVSVRNTVRALSTETVSASPLPGSSPGTNPPADPENPPVATNPGDSEFEALLRGQGRNLNILGDEKSFVATVVRNGERNLIGKESYVRQLYQAGVAGNINPLILLTLWGEESGFRVDGSSLGCDPRRKRYEGLARQAVCAVDTFNFWMKSYEEKKDNEGNAPIEKSDGSGVCLYNDPMLYAMEWYGPVCHADDGNQNFHRNFANMYKKFLGR